VASRAVSDKGSVERHAAQPVPGQGSGAALPLGYRERRPATGGDHRHRDVAATLRLTGPSAFLRPRFAQGAL